MEGATRLSARTRSLLRAARARCGQKVCRTAFGSAVDNHVAGRYRMRHARGRPPGELQSGSRCRDVLQNAPALASGREHNQKRTSGAPGRRPACRQAEVRDHRNAQFGAIACASPACHVHANCARIPGRAPGGRALTVAADRSTCRLCFSVVCLTPPHTRDRGASLSRAVGC